MKAPRWSRWVVAPLCLFVLPLSVVFTTGPAYALVQAPPRVEIGETIKKVPVGNTVKTVGKLNPIVRTGMALLSLYSTADTVFSLGDSVAPNGDDSFQDNTGRSTGSCQISAGDASFDARTITLKSSWSGCSDRASQPQVQFTRVTCRVNATQAAPRYLTGSTPYVQSNYTGTWPSTGVGQGTVSYGPITLCPVDTSLQGASFYTAIGPTSVPGRSPTISVGQPYPDGDYVQTTTVQCRKPDGTVVEIVESLTGYPSEIVIPSCEDRVPGSIPWGVKATGGPEGVPPDTLTEVIPDRDAFTKWPDCFGPAGLKCVTRVYVGGQPCTFGMPGCINWREDLTKDPSKDTTCRFGPYVVPITECAPLKRSYRKKNTGVLTGNGPASDPEVRYRDDPEDYPEPNPTVRPNPIPNPSQGPGPTTGPNPTGPRTSPNKDTDADTRDCFGDAWSWNPVDWVYVPVKCAVIWAFKPKTSFSARMTRMTDVLKGRQPFNYVSGLAMLPAQIPGGACPDWVIEVKGRSENIVCGKSYTNAIRAARPVLTAFMITLALWPLIRSIAYGSVPIIRATPVGGR